MAVLGNFDSENDFLVLPKLWSVSYLYKSFLRFIILLILQLPSFLMILGGHDDAKLSIPATVVLRYMFAPAEMRVIYLSREREKQRAGF